MKAEFQPPKRTTTTLHDTFTKPPIHKLTLNIDPDIHRDLKTAAAAQGRTMREIIEELVNGYLDPKN